MSALRRLERLEGRAIHEAATDLLAAIEEWATKAVEEIERQYPGLSDDERLAVAEHRDAEIRVRDGGKHAREVEAIDELWTLLPNFLNGRATVEQLRAVLAKGFRWGEPGLPLLSMIGAITEFAREGVERVAVDVAR